MKKSKAEKDLELVEAYKSGDDKAFAELFNRYSESIKFRMFKKTNDMDVAEDLMMEVFTKVVKSLKSFKTKNGAFSTWLYKIADNHFIDYLRKTANHSVVRLDELTHESEDGNDFKFQVYSEVEKTPQDVLENQQRVSFAHKLIESISNELTRAMIKMRFIDELSYEEISKATGSPLGTVKGTLFRAKQEMANNAKGVDIP
jgi:RNA polymerase sigma-70 factor (ECF subfamily)